MAALCITDRFRATKRIIKKINMSNPNLKLYDEPEDQEANRSLEDAIEIENLKDLLRKSFEYVYHFDTDLGLQIHTALLPKEEKNVNSKQFWLTALGIPEAAKDEPKNKIMFKSQKDLVQEYRHLLDLKDQHIKKLEDENRDLKSHAERLEIDLVSAKQRLFDLLN